MPFDIFRFVMGKVIAANQGVSDDRATQLGLIGAVMPGSPVFSAVIPLVIAQREAETNPVVPSATTQAASNLTETTATLNGIVNAGNAPTTVTFELVKANDDGTREPLPPLRAKENPISGNGETSVSADLTGLVPNTTYFFRVVADNSAGTSRGDELDFTTLPAAPVATTLEAKDVTATGATLNGIVNAGEKPLDVSFVLFTIRAPEQRRIGDRELFGVVVSATPNQVSGNNDTPVKFDATDLPPSTTFFFRVIAENSEGKVEGKEETFTTLEAAPSAITEPIDSSSVTHNSATLEGTVNAANTSMNVRFALSKVIGDSILILPNLPATPPQATGTNDTRVRVNPSLEPASNYSFRVEAVAENDPETIIKGNDVSFTTLAAVITGDATNIQATSVTLKGTIKAGTRVNNVHFELFPPDIEPGQTPIEVRASQSDVNATSDTEITGEATGLETDKLHQFRLVATNAIGNLMQGELEPFTPTTASGQVFRAQLTPTRKRSQRPGAVVKSAGDGGKV